MEGFEDPLKLAMLAITGDRLDRAIEYADGVLEHEENKHTPVSPVGILRSYGLLVVGVKKLEKHCKVTEVPEELRGKVEGALRQ